MGASAPKPPDPYKVSDAQTTSNIATARSNAQLNAMNQNFGPFGSSSYDYDPTDPRNVGHKAGDYVPTGQSLNFSPEVLSFVQKQLGLSNTMADKTTAQLNRLPTDAFDPSSIGDTSSIAKTAYARQLGLMQPQMDDAKTKLTTSLADRGIAVGSDIWNNEMNRYDQAQGQTLTGLSQDADLAAGTEYQRLLSNALQIRNLPFSELNALEGATPGVSQPSFATTIPSQIAGTDIQGNVWNAYNAQVSNAASSNSLFGSGLGALGTVGGALVGKSSKKYKEDFHPVSGSSVLDKLDKLPVSDYKYKPLAQALFDTPESRTGPMAEDYAKQFGGDGETIDFASMTGHLLAGMQELHKEVKHLKQAKS